MGKLSWVVGCVLHLCDVKSQLGGIAAEDIFWVQLSQQSFHGMMHRQDREPGFNELSMLGGRAKRTIRGRISA